MNFTCQKPTTFFPVKDLDFSSFFFIIEVNKALLADGWPHNSDSINERLSFSSLAAASSYYNRNGEYTNMKSNPHTYHLLSGADSQPPAVGAAVPAPAPKTVRFDAGLFYFMSFPY